MMNRRVLFLAGVVSGALVAAGCTKSTLAGSGSPTSSQPTPSATASGNPPGVTYCSTGGGSMSGLSGSLDCLNFDIVGDTRPANAGDTSAYPTPIINQIYTDIQNDGTARFVIGTGDYQFTEGANNPTESNAQVALYQQAEALFTNGPNYLAMGNHECTGDDDSNCGTLSSETDGITPNYTNYMTLLAPAGTNNLPYYVVNVQSTAASLTQWTAKFIFIAANSWDTSAANTQGVWLTNALAQPSTYTFVIRHEEISSSTPPPGLTGSQNIIQPHQNTGGVTWLLEGHDHLLKLDTGSQELVNGIGGAPLDAGDNYGYVAVRQRSDGNMDFTAYDYLSHAVLLNFVITPAGKLTN